MSSGSQQYTDTREHGASPVGIFRECRHVQSGEWRGLKELRPDLAEKQAFFTWYTAALKLAGEAAEYIRIPTLIAPIKTPEGEWFSLRGGSYIIERPFYGTPACPAYNLNEFLDKFTDAGRGVDEAAALSIMSLVAGVLKKMHSTRLPGAQGILLKGVPHLNLKPENVIIGMEPRSQEYQVRLTDYLIATSSPLAEVNGVRAPLNYSSPKVLREDYYYGLSGDIFSCGLLLYRLVENEDLIPAENRESTLKFIETGLPEKLHHLKLTKASGRTRHIIQRCLTTDSSEQFSSIEEFKAEIDQALKGKNPSETIRDCVETPQEVGHEIKESLISRCARSLKERLSGIGRTAIWAAAGIVVVIAAWLIWDSLGESQIRDSLQQRSDGLRQTLASLYDRTCIGYDQKMTFESNLAGIDEAISTGNWDGAVADLNELDHKLTPANDLCVRFAGLFTRREGLAEQESKDSLHEKYFPLFSTYLDSAGESIAGGDLDGTSVYLDQAEQYLDFLRREWLCDQSLLSGQLQKAFAKLNSDCLQDGQYLMDQAELACSQNDSATFFDAREQLIELASNADCVDQGKVVPLDCNDQLDRLFARLDVVSNDCRAGAQEIVNAAQAACETDDRSAFNREKFRFATFVEDCEDPDECNAARQKLARTEGDFNRFRAKYDGRNAPFDLDTNFIQAVGAFETAKQQIDAGDCPKGGWSADLSRSYLKKVTPCIRQRDLYQVVASCLKNSGRTDEQVEMSLSFLDDMFRKCQCQSIEEQLSFLKNRLEQDGFNCSGNRQDVDPSQFATYEECLSRYKSGDREAWKYCARVSPRDPLYQDAMKVFILAAGADGRFGVDFRSELQSAYNNSSVDRSNTEENAMANAIMCLSYGWDTTSINCNQAMRYFNESQRVGYAASQLRIWWMVKLVEVRCKVRSWRINPTNINLRQDAASSIRRFFKLLSETQVANKEMFETEVRSYRDEIR